MIWFWHIAGLVVHEYESIVCGIPGNPVNNTDITDSVPAEFDPFLKILRDEGVEDPGIHIQHEADVFGDSAREKGDEGCGNRPGELCALGGRVRGRFKIGRAHV